VSRFGFLACCASNDGDTPKSNSTLANQTAGRSQFGYSSLKLPPCLRGVACNSPRHQGSVYESVPPCIAAYSACGDNYATCYICIIRAKTGVLLGVRIQIHKFFV